MQPQHFAHCHSTMEVVYYCIKAIKCLNVSGYTMHDKLDEITGEVTAHLNGEQCARILAENPTALSGRTDSVEDCGAMGPEEYMRVLAQFTLWEVCCDLVNAVYGPYSPEIG